MAIDPNRAASDRKGRTLIMTLGGIIVAVALILVLAGVVTRDAADKGASATTASADDAALGDTMNDEAPAAGVTDPDEEAFNAGDDTSEDMAAANATSDATVGDTADDTGMQTAVASSGACNFSHLIGSTASEAANAIREANREFYMVTPDVDTSAISDIVRNEQVRIDVDNAGRVTNVTCPAGT